MAENRKLGTNRLDTTDKGQAYFDESFGINKGKLPVVNQGWEGYVLTIGEDNRISLTTGVSGSGGSTALGDRITTGSIIAAVNIGSNIFRVQSGSSTFLYISSSGNIGIGTTSPSSTLHISGTFKAQIPNLIQTKVLGIDNNGNITIFDTSSIIAAGGGGNVIGTGTSNYIPLWTDVSTIATSSLFQFNKSHYQLISPTAPGYGIHLVATGSGPIIGFSNTSGESNSGSLSIIGAFSSNFNIQHRLANGNIVFWTSGSEGITEKMTIKAEGGVSASKGFTGSLFGTSSWAQNASNAINAQTASFITSTSTNAFIQGGNSFGAPAVLGTNDNQNLQLETSNSVRMTIISSSGNIGIGTTTPFALLDISGSTIIRGALTASIISASNQISGSDLRIANSANIGGTLGVTGATTLVGALTASIISASNQISGSDLRIANSANIGGTLGVTGITTLQNNLIISGSTILGSSSAQIVTSNVGFITSPDFISGWAGKGWRLDYSSNLSSSLDLDNLTVRGQLRVFELVINQIRATNGSLFVSSVGKVVSGSFISGNEYFLTFDTASGDVGHGFAKGDVIRAQRVNRAALTGSGVTQSIAGNLIYQSNLIVRNVNNLSSLTASWISGTIPTGSIAQGMEFVRLGNSESLNRQGTIYLTADDSHAPFIDVIDGVKSHDDWNNASGSGGVKVRMGKLNGITSPTFGPLTASGNNSLYGFWASGSAYLEGGINATFGNIAGWTINTSAITKSGLELNSSGTFFRAGTIASNLTSGTGILLSGSGDAVVGNPTGHRISFIDNNLTISASNAILKGNTVEISGSNFHLLNGNITASNVRLSGNITATSGSIGGFEITPTEIKSTGSLNSGSFTSPNISLKATGQITGSDVLIHRVISGSLYILLDTVAGLIDARNVGRQIITSNETYAYVGPTSTGTSNPPIIASFPCRLLSGENTLIINYSLEGKFGNALNTTTIIHGAGVSIQTSSTGSSISSSGNYNSWGTETNLIPATSFFQTSTSASSIVGKILSDTNQQSIVDIPSQFNGKYCRINLKILQAGPNQGSTTQTQVAGFSVVSTRQFAASSSINSSFTPYSLGS
jgi:hypothetical protein